jgi:integrase
VFRPRGVGRREAARTVTLGSWPSLGLKAAKAAAEKQVGEVALGRDPAADLRATKTQERRMLDKALDEFERALSRRKIVNAKTAMSALRRGLSPYKAREIGTLTRADFVKRIDALEAAGLPGAASDLRKHSRSFLEWAVGQGLAPFNVMAGLRRPRASRAERLEGERTGRALTDEEVASLWQAAAGLGTFGGLLRLGMLTGLRRSELAGLCWSDVKDDRIGLAAHGTKTGVAHEVPITSAMRAVLAAQPRDTTGLVFPSSRRRDEAKLSGWTQLVASAAKASGVDFRLHDLRRTVRTLMSRLEVAEEVAELAIGHVRRGLVATYNKDGAWTARVDAFERVSAHIAKIIASTGAAEDEAGAVVSMHGARRT